jgi:Peptidase family M1 domain
MRRRATALVSLFVCLLTFLVARAFTAVQPTSTGPNSDPVYQQLRNAGLSGEAVSVSNLDLKREIGTFHLRSGTICFLTPAQGKVTGAVFMGDGNLVIDTDSATERSMLRLLTKEDEFSENFNHLVLRFTDSTYDEIKKAGSAASGSCDAGLLKDSQNATRHKLKDNLELRILEDVLSTEPGMLFAAFVHGKRYSDKELYMVDPHGTPDQVILMTYDEAKYGVWAALHLSPENRRTQKWNRDHIEHQLLDTIVEKNANLAGKATTTFVSHVNGLRVVPFELFPSLRVQSVFSENGTALSFVQEDKNDDADFGIVLAKPLSAGERLTIVTTYAGKDAVTNEGGGNYFPVARTSWYPNNPTVSLGEYTNYDMKFRIPKGMKMAATGTLVSDSTEGGQNVSVWKSEAPQTVAGFNFGKFKVEEAKLAKPEYLIQSFANEEPPNWVRGIQQAVDLPAQGMERSLRNQPEVALGNLNTTGLNKKALAEAQLAVEVYSNYFGPSSYKRLAITQQTACNFGQSWPELVWIPLCYFFDTTVRHQLGMDWGDRGYWKVVTPHEVAHQWWGHSVGFSSYRDQWMSEGFADMSASLFLQTVYSKEPGRFIQFWNDERDMLLERNKEGFRAIDAGPLTMGYRLSNTRSGYDITRRLIYPKGAYVLHMIRMMMMDRKTGDQQFKAMMQDFVKTYANQAATTEDFKTTVEKFMTPEMDLDRNHRLDWFFDEYVYGTALPNYKLEYSFEDSPDGVQFKLRLAQSGVDQNFKMLVPIYLEMNDGRLMSIGRARLLGNTRLEQTVALKGWKEKPKRAIVNYYDDVLAGAN